MNNSPKHARSEAIRNKFGKIKSKVIDATSDVLSAPKRMYFEGKARKYSNEYNTLAKAREHADQPNFDSKGNPTAGLKYRTAAEVIRSKRKGTSQFTK